MEVELPRDLVAEIVERAADLAVEKLAGSSRSSDSPYMSIPEAASYLRCKRQRIDDLLSSGRLTRYKDGGRTLLRRGELKDYVATTARRGDTPVTPLPRSRPQSQLTE